jgi:phage tail sheath protein FI/uncharacterized protein YjdB
MASFTYPGVYIEELSSGQHTITGVATSIGAFVGWAPMGPVTAATLVESWADYQTQFGGLDTRSWLGYAVNQFFANGGSQCYIVRLVWDPTTMSGGANSPVGAATALAAAVGYGSATITAALGTGASQVIGTLALGAGVPVLQSVAVGVEGLAATAALPPLPYGATLQLTAAGSAADGSSPAPAGVVWGTSDATIATVSPSGLVTATGTNQGPVTITAASGIIEGSTTITVTAAQIASIAVTPAVVTAAVGQTAQLAAVATYSGGTKTDITGIAVFTSNPAAPATLTSTPGQFKAAAAGAASITATLPATWTLAGVAPTATPAALTVTAATVASMAITPANASVPVSTMLEAGQTEPTGFTAAVTMSDGTTGATPAVTWTSSNAAVAAFQTVTISEYSIDNADTATFTYSGNQLTAGESVALSGFQTSTFLNGQTAVVEAGVTANAFQAAFVHGQVAATPEAGLGTVNPGSFALGTAGTTTIMASYTPTGASMPVTASTQLTVISGHLTGVSVSPATPTLAAGLTQQMTATGTFDNGTFVSMTGFATWATSNAAVATVVATTGLVKALTAGSVTITATWMETSGTTTVTVAAAIPETIAITTVPLNQTSIAAGTNLSLVATATMSDGSTQTVTNAAMWASSSPLVTVTGPGVVSAAATAGGSLTLFASSPGVWGNSLLVSVTPQAANPSKFSLLVQQSANGQVKTLESYSNLSVDKTDQNYVVTVIDNDSSYITFINPLDQSIATPTAAPAAAGPVTLTGGADGTVLWPADGNFEIAMFPTTNPNGGVHLLDRVSIFNLLCVPGETDGPTISTLQGYCVQTRAFMIVDPPQNTTIAKMIQSGPVGTGGGNITDQSVAGNSAMYFPWIEAPDPLAANRSRLFPPCGFVAGIYAATDAARGVWKAPAGIQAGIIGNSGLQFVMTDIENGNLNIQAVNCQREFKVYGDVVWGARTLAGNDQAGSQWKYVPIRRLALFLESSLFDGTQWVVFEPNDSPLWGQIRMNVGTFMQGLFLQGAFAGTTPAQAYFVKCDAENNPPASVALGVVNILVGFAPLYPAEFVVIQIQQIVAQAS